MSPGNQSLVTPTSNALLERALRDKLQRRAETIGSPLQRRSKKLIALVGANNKKPARPFFPHQVLRKAIG